MSLAEKFPVPSDFAATTRINEEQYLKKYQQSVDEPENLLA